MMMEKIASSDKYSNLVTRTWVASSEPPTATGIQANVEKDLNGEPIQLGPTSIP